MDDERIRQLTSEVMGHLRSTEVRASPDTERRLAALEATVARIESALLSGVPRPTGPPQPHPSLRVLPGTGGGSPQSCVMEPDKPCVQSHACRTFGH